MNYEEIPIDPIAISDWMRKHTDDLANAKANRYYLEHFTDSLKARLMKEAMLAGEKTIAGQERYAQGHNDYHQHLLGIKEAIAIEEKMKWLMLTAQSKIEIWRSMESSKRAEMQMI
ncbi:MAG: hypothetical protein EBU82_11905 [Flavobacteriia bacterium]|nr:hypothetical protein [Flavobacteriia bacterium]